MRAVPAANVMTVVLLRDGADVGEHAASAPSCVDDRACYEDVAATAIIVVVILASKRVRVASKTEPSHTVSVRPVCTTCPTAISRSVFAGLRK